MRTSLVRRALGAAVIAAVVSTAPGHAQQTPAAATAPAGSGGANNPAIAGARPAGPAPRLPNGKPDFSGVWVGGGPVGDIREGLVAGEEIKLKPDAERLMKSRMAADDPEA